MEAEKAAKSAGAWLPVLSYWIHNAVPYCSVVTVKTRRLFAKVRLLG